MKKKVVVLLTVFSLVLLPVLAVPAAPNSPILSLFNHGEG